MIETIAIVAATASIVSTLIGTISTIFSKRMKMKSQVIVTIKTEKGAEISIPLNSGNKKELEDLIKTLSENDTITSIKL